MKNLKLVLSIQFMIIFVLSYAQNPSIEWQKCIGGSDNDDATSIIQTSDGGYITVGCTSSNDFDINCNHGFLSDIFVVKISNNGNIIWKRCLGGSDSEIYPVIKETDDSGYIISSITNSNDGDISGIHVSNTHYDGWIVKLDSLGNIIWQKCYGGTDEDDVYDIILTEDGGYIFVGSTLSIDGDLLNLNFYSNSIQGWIVKIDSVGNIVWQKLLGGSYDDIFYSVSKTLDGNYVIAGVTSSDDGDVVGNTSIESGWILKLSETGSILWQKCLNRGVYSRVTDIIQSSNGNILATCEYMPTSTSFSNFNCYVLNLSNSGNVVWEKEFGGTREDYLKSIQETSDGGFIVGGSTFSWDGDLANFPTHGDQDFWIVKLTGTGDISWHKCLGGTRCDELYSIEQTSDLGFIIAGSTNSKDGDVIGYNFIDPFESSDNMWIVKLSPNVFVNQDNVEETMNIFPNPTSNILNIQTETKYFGESYQIISILGQVVAKGTINSENMKIDVSSLGKGVYIVKIGERYFNSLKFLKN